MLARRLRPIADMVALTKPRVVALNALLTGAVFMSAGHAAALGRGLAATLGVALSVAAANALNMVWEQDTDALMERTRRRPLPTGRLTSTAALLFGLLLAAAGNFWLVFTTNGLTALLATAALAVYVLAYTPLKRRTRWALIVGAVPGAVPPLLGWTAASGRVEWPAIVFAGLLFFWQMPHFLAIALRHQTDYRRAGLRIGAAGKDDRLAYAQASLCAAALLPLSLVLIPLQGLGWRYAIAALAAGLFLWLPTLGRRRRSVDAGRWARRVFVASLIYLPLLVAGLALDGVWR